LWWKITRATISAVAVLLLLAAPTMSVAAGQPDRSPVPVSDAVLARWALQASVVGIRDAPVSAAADASASQPASGPVLPGYAGPRDANGVVMSTYSYFSYPVYNPVHVAEWALHWYGEYAGGAHPEDHDAFFAQAAWLRDTCQGDPLGRLPYLWDYAARGLKAPWYSCMAQGLAIEVFTRAYALTADPTWLDAARRAEVPFTVDVGSGGVAYASGSQLWLEQYPDKPASHVLNAEMFAMCGLQDLINATGDATATAVVQRCADTLAPSLWRYESKGAILYQLTGENYSFDTYYAIVVQQLATIATFPELSADTTATFARYAQRWKDLRAYPLPVVTVAAPRSVRRGTRVGISVTVSSIYRAAPFLVTQTSGGVSKNLVLATPTPTRANRATFTVVSRGLSTRTVFTVTPVNDPSAARHAVVGVVGSRH